MDNIKPVYCGCGGEAEIFHIAPEGYEGSYCVRCTECLTQTPFFNKDKNKAIEAWNKAMGERTAKVEDIQVEWGDDEYVNDRMGDMYHYGNCSNCGETVSHNQKYCHECGARLEWK